MTGIYTRKFSNSKKLISSLTKRKFGKFWLKWPRLLRFCMKRKSFTETWSQQTYLWTGMEAQNWEIWMFRKLPRKGYSIPKRERHIMHLLRCGKINLTTANQIFGLSDVWYMKAQLWNRHSEHRIWMDFTREFSRVHTQKYQKNTPRTLLTLSWGFWALSQSWGRHANRSWTCLK